jgi:hypothetical protein
VRIPGATLLIAIGLFTLWLAVTGKLDQLWTGVAVAQGKVKVPAQTADAGGGGSGFAVLDPSTYHMNSMLFALQPSVALSHPGGLS